MAVLEQFLQQAHIPNIIYQGQGAAQSEILPDWLSATYLDLQESVLQYTLHTVSETDISQPDGISYTNYGRSDWWWLICTYNGIVNPITDMYIGQKLRIPALQQTQLLLQVLDRNENRIGQNAVV
jgi:hypothetical protein